MEVEENFAKKYRPFIENKLKTVEDETSDIVTKKGTCCMTLSKWTFIIYNILLLVSGFSIDIESIMFTLHCTSTQNIRNGKAI